MEFWPKRKQAPKEKPLVLETTFGPGFTDAENARLPREFDHIETPEQFLDTVDFDTLNAIFDDLTRRSDSPEGMHHTGHRVTKERTTFFPAGENEPWKVYGRAFIHSGKIELLWDEHAPVSSKARALRTLQALAHEATHVRGGYQHERIPMNALDAATGQIETFDKRGYEQVHARRRPGVADEFAAQGTDLNEAVTEEIAYDVFKAYLDRTGTSGYLKDPDVLATLQWGEYADERMALMVVMQALARELGVERNVVWRGIVQGYMSGNAELLELMKELDETLKNSPVARSLLEPLKKNTTIDEYQAGGMDRFEPVPAKQQQLLETIANWPQMKRLTDALKLK